MQEADPASEYVPLTHASSKTPFLQKKPARHAVIIVDLREHAYPGWHFTWRDGSGQNMPAGQSKLSSEDPSAQYEPAAHLAGTEEFSAQ